MNLMDLFSLEGKNAVVIGGSRGLGKGIAVGLAQGGATVTVCSRNEKACLEAAQEIAEKSGRPAFGAAIDIEDEQNIAEVFEKIIAERGGLDILVNSAGINIRKPAEEYTPQDWDKVQNIQLRGPFFTCQTAAKYWIANGIQGRIINISSVNAKVVARPNIVSYVAAKGGVMQMTKALAAEWAKYGIRVNAIAPGFFKTELTKVLFENKQSNDEICGHTPMGRPGDPDRELAGAAVYFASDASSYTTGQLLCVDGGYTTI